MNQTYPEWGPAKHRLDPTVIDRYESDAELPDDN